MDSKIASRSGLGAGSKRLDNTLCFEGSPETFFCGINIAVSRGAHASGNTLLLKQSTIRQLLYWLPRSNDAPNRCSGNDSSVPYVGRYPPKRFQYVHPLPNRQSCVKTVVRLNIIYRFSAGTSPHVSMQIFPSNTRETSHADVGRCR
jgi:hypothetical protein